MTLALMLKEEYRLHSNYSSKRLFLAFPAMVILLSAMTGVTMHALEDEVPMDQMVVFTHASVLLYGISVGAFGFLGRNTVERSQGKVNFLVAMPALLPLSYRRMFLLLYLRDIIYYFVLMLIPALIGLLISVPISGFSLVSIGLTFGTLAMAFLVGISLSFMVSVLYTRSMVAFGCAVLAVISAALAVSLGQLPIDLLIPPLGIHHALWPRWNGSEAVMSIIISILMVAASSLIASVMVREDHDVHRSESSDMLPRLRERMPGGFCADLVAKELIDVLRSGTIGKMTFSFVFPLLILGALIWYVNNLGMPVGFNSVFFAAIAGFFGVSFYSWLTNMDHMDYYSTLPVSVPMLVRTKLITYLLLTTAISAAAVVTISYINHEVGLLWLALPVMAIMSVYMVTATAYLTGLSPNSMLFDPEVLSKFMVISFLPDVCLTILSFSIGSPFAIAGIGVVCAVLIATASMFFKAMDGRWEETSFE
jgi:hypothetical protein